MMTSDDKVGGWVKKGQNHDDVILEWSLIKQRELLSWSKFCNNVTHILVTKIPIRKAVDNA